jgi:hypothetical protein
MFFQIMRHPPPNDTRGPYFSFLFFSFLFFSSSEASPDSNKHPPTPGRPYSNYSHFKRPTCPPNTALLAARPIERVNGDQEAGSGQADDVGEGRESRNRIGAQASVYDLHKVQKTSTIGLKLSPFS